MIKGFSSRRIAQQIPSQKIQIDDEASGRGAFSGYLDSLLEESILVVLLKGAENAGGDTFIIDIALGKLRDLMGSRIESLLRGIVARLVDPTFDIRWSWSSKICRDFCDKLRSLFPPSPGAGTVDYSLLMSFTCRLGLLVAQNSW